MGYSGYATVSSNLIPRLQEISHHEFIFFTRSGRYSSTPGNYEGVPMVSPPNTGGLPEQYLPPLMDRFDADMVLHIMDAWILDKAVGKLKIPAMSYSPIDTTPLSPRWYTVIKHMLYTVVPYNEFGKRQIENAGLSNVREPIYHGVDMSERGFRPRPEKGILDFDVEDPFIVGIYKANVGTRANYDNMLDGIKIFLDNNPDAKKDFGLYIHASKVGQQGYNLEALLNLFELTDCTKFPDQTQYNNGEITPFHLSQTYSDLDVLLNASRAEGFGLPIMESLACKTPAIITNGSAMKDVFDEGVIKVDCHEKGSGIGEPDALEMRPRKMSYYWWPKVEEIADKLEYGYNHPEKLDKLGKKGHEWVKQYTWENIAPQWVDVLNDIEDELLFDEEELDDMMEDLDLE